MLYFPSLVCWNGKFGSKLCGLFDKTQNRPCIGSCGHSVCMPCLETNPYLKCPICQTEGSFVGKNINYIALDWIDMFYENCVDVYEKWWKETQQTIGSGYCSHCASDTTSLRICVTCELTSPSPILECKEDLVTLKIDTVSVAKLPLSLKCSDCIGDEDHEGHRVVKLQNVTHSEIRIKECSHEVASRFLKKGLENWKGRDCKLRRDRMMKTCEMLCQHIRIFCGETTKIVLFESERADLRLKSEEINRYLESLKAQWTEYKENQEEKCDCTELWEKTNFKDVLAGIFTVLEYQDLEQVVPGCPLNMEKNRALRNSIGFALDCDRKKALKQLRKEPVKPALDLKGLLQGDAVCSVRKRIVPTTTASSTVLPIKVNSTSNATVPFEARKSLYNQVEELTNNLQSLVNLVPEESLQDIPDIPKIPKLAGLSTDSESEPFPILISEYAFLG